MTKPGADLEHYFMITLTDTFNSHIISRHRSVLAAVRAQRRHLRTIRRHNGPTSYLTYSITGPGATADEIEYAHGQVDDEERATA